MGVFARVPTVFPAGLSVPFPEIPFEVITEATNESIFLLNNDEIGLIYS